MRSASPAPHEKPLVKATLVPAFLPTLLLPWRSARVSFVLHALAMVGVLTTITALIERAAP